MSSPQLENGYTPIANEILESMAGWNFSAYEMRIVLFIIRKTYGYAKKDDWISLSQFVLGTGIARPHVCRTLRMLIGQNIVTKGGTTRQPLYRFQKDSSRWVSLPKGARSHYITKGGNQVVPKGVIQVVPKGAHTKETITKEILQKKPPISPLREPAYFANPEVKELYLYGIEKGFTTGKEQSQCWAIGRLLKKYPKDKLVGAVDASLRLIGVEYAPQISNFMDLEEKIIKLAGYVKREQNRPQGVVSI